MTNIGGYEFKNEGLLKEALTHSSYSPKSYERLEFLGDSILDFLVAEILFKDSTKKEDELTRTRSNIVSEDALCKVFDGLNIEDKVLISKSLPRPTRAVKADIVESLVAVIYLESGIEECIKFIRANLDFTATSNKDYKTEFQEFAQKHKYSFHYELEKTEGPAHNLKFFTKLIVNGNEISCASASSKMESEKLCAKKALEIFNK